MPERGLAQLLRRSGAFLSLAAACIEQVRMQSLTLASQVLSSNTVLLSYPFLAAACISLVHK